MMALGGPQTAGHRPDQRTGELIPTGEAVGRIVAAMGASDAATPILDKGE